MDATNFSEDLKQSGLKKTKHRIAILDILEKSKQPISADDIFLKLTEKEMATNLSTVYRILETLTDKSLVTKLNIASENRTLYEYNRQIHRHYLICLKCKSILPINCCPLKEYEKSLADEEGYVIVDHKLTIYGYCPKCQKYLKK